DGDAAPHQDALPLGRALVGVEVRTHRRMDAVGADQDVGLGGLDDAAVAVGEASGHLRALLLEGGDAPAKVDPVGAEPAFGAVEQDHLQFAAMNRELRPRQAGMAAARIGPDGLAMAIGVAQLARLDAGRGQCRLEPERRQDAGRAGLDVDADAERPELVHLVEHLDLEAGAFQAHGGGQAADARAGDDDFHRTAPLRWRSWFMIAPLEWRGPMSMITDRG